MGNGTEGCGTITPDKRLTTIFTAHTLHICAHVCITNKIKLITNAISSQRHAINEAISYEELNKSFCFSFR